MSWSTCRSGLWRRQGTERRPILSRIKEMSESLEIAPRTAYQTAAVASARLWESFEDEADPHVALQKCIDASQEMIESELDKGIELEDTVRELTSTTERLRTE